MVKPREILILIIRHKSAIVLIVANMIPLFGLFFAGWNAFDMVFLYWLENVIIGFFNVCKMLTYGLIATPDFKTGEPGKRALTATERLQVLLAMVLLSAFFCFHYGIFTFVHGVFVVSFMQFGQVVGGGAPQSGFDIVPYAMQRVRGDLLIPFLSLFASHGFSFVYNFLYKREYTRVTAMGIMAAPYGRVLVMHFTVLIGGIISMFLPVFMAVLLVVMKTGIDLGLHLKEREKGTISPLDLVPRKTPRGERAKAR
jgi:hypothetical protein